MKLAGSIRKAENVANAEPSPRVVHRRHALIAELSRRLSSVPEIRIHSSDALKRSRKQINFFRR
jgi:hypothetical protein